MVEAVLEELKRWGVVSGGADFSRTWLGMEESYWRSLKSKRRRPSPQAIATCAARLHRKARLMEKSTLPEARRVADRLALLANRCVEELLSFYGETR
jgi:hypothetical protein